MYLWILIKTHSEVEMYSFNYHTEALFNILLKDFPY